MHVCLLLPVIMCLFLPSAVADLGLPHCGVTGRHCMTGALHAAHIYHLVQLLGLLQERRPQHRVHRLLPGAEERVHPPRCAGPALWPTLANPSHGRRARMSGCAVVCNTSSRSVQGWLHCRIAKLSSLSSVKVEETASCGHLEQLQPARTPCINPGSISACVLFANLRA